MARHEVVIHENTGALRETAPYIGSYISKEQVVMAGFAEAVGAKCGLPPIQVVAIIGGAFEAISDLERDALVRVRTDIGVVCGVITGSFPSADAAFDPARNALELALRLDDTLRLDLSDTVPTIITAKPMTRESSIVVCTVRSAFSRLPAPSDCAITTFAPSEIPIATLTKRLIKELFELTAAGEITGVLEKLPITMRSTALKRSWSTPDRARGMEKARSFGRSFPVVISIPFFSFNRLILKLF